MAEGILGGHGEGGGVGRIRRSVLCARMRSLGGDEEWKVGLERAMSRAGRSLHGQNISHQAGKG